MNVSSDMIIKSYCVPHYAWEMVRTHYRISPPLCSLQQLQNITWQELEIWKTSQTKYYRKFNQMLFNPEFLLLCRQYIFGPGG